MVVKETVQMQFEVGIEDVDRVVSYLLNTPELSNIWLFVGDLGVGKTYLVTQLAKQLGIVDLVSSPTYSILNEYKLANSDPLYHFDFYRVNTEEEALDIGLVDYLDSDFRCFVEWPQIIENYLPTNYTEIRIDYRPDNNRSYTILNHE